MKKIFKGEKKRLFFVKETKGVVLKRKGKVFSQITNKKRDVVNVFPFGKKIKKKKCSLSVSKGKTKKILQTKQTNWFVGILENPYNKMQGKGLNL